MEIIIDNEFKKLLPELDPETFAWLEESLLEYGCMNPLVLWNGTLIDGHNRYKIIKKHDLPFNTVNMEFDSRDDVIIWIISTQLARRNLSQLQLSHFRGLHYNTEKRRVRNQDGRNQHSEVWVQNEPKPQERRTSQILAEQYNVSPSTIKRDSQISTAIMAIGEISPEAKLKILSGRGNISRQRLQELASGTEDELKETAERIVDGTHERRQSRTVVQDEDGSDQSESVLNQDEPSQNKSLATPDENSDDDNSEQFEQLSFENFLNQVTDNFKIKLKNIPNSKDPIKSKTALREFIDMLEELYQKI